MPLMPPYGSLFLDLDDLDEAVVVWTRHQRVPVSEDARANYRAMLGRVRDRGWSLGLVAPRHDEIWDEVTHFTQTPATPEAERRMGRLLEELTPFYEPPDLAPDARHDVRSIAAPVRAGGRAVMALVLYGLPAGASAAQVEQWVARLSATADAVASELALAPVPAVV